MPTAVQLEDTVSKDSEIKSSLTAEQRACLLLWQRVNTSLSACYKLVTHFETAQSALQAGMSQWKNLGIHKKHLQRHKQATARACPQFNLQ